MAVLALDTTNFDTEIRAAGRTVLVDFWASWCGPCRMMAPVIDEVAEAHPEVRVGKVNADEVPELAARYGVSSIPTLMVFRDGKAIQTAVGVQPKQAVEAMLK